MIQHAKMSQKRKKKNLLVCGLSSKKIEFHTCEDVSEDEVAVKML